MTQQPAFGIACPHLAIGPGGSDAPLLFLLPHSLGHQHEIQHPLGRCLRPRPLRRIVTLVLRLQRGPVGGVV